MTSVRIYARPQRVVVSSKTSAVRVLASAQTIVRVIKSDSPGAPAPSTGFTFPQTTPAATWTVNHGLGYRPLVAVSDLGGNSVVANVLHLSLNTLQIQFNSPIAGTARIN